MQTPRRTEGSARWDLAFVERLVSRLTDDDDPDVLLRVRVLVLYSGLLVLLSLLWSLSHFAYHNWGVAALYVLSGLLFVGVVVKLWWDRNLPAASHSVVALTLAAATASTYLTGGLRLTNVCVFFMILVSAFFLVGRSGLWWSGGAMATALAFQVAGWLGYPFPDLVPVEDRAVDAFATWSSMALIVLIFAWSYEGNREDVVRRLVQANRAKSQLLANVSHELRTPLHVMSSAQELLRRTALTGEQRALLSTTRQSAEALESLVDDLLDLASLQRGSFSLEPADFAPGHAVQAVAAIAHHQCAEAGLDLTVEIEPDLPGWVRGDRRRLQQILGNLTQNAVKFTDVGGVSLVARPGDGPSTCVFEVRDTGIGIEPADRERVFAPFTQVDSSLTRARDGAGLGLAICAELVELMGGTLEVDSVPGEGSTFTICVPFQPPLTSREVHTPPSSPPRVMRRLPHRLTVLVAEDNDDSRELLGSMLGGLGQEAILACNGLEAVVLWQRTEPDLVLMDVQMPELDGLSATRRIRAREADLGRKPVPIVAVTGHREPDLLERYTQAGIERCLFKPYGLRELVELLAEAGAR